MIHVLAHALTIHVCVFSTDYWATVATIDMGWKEEGSCCAPFAAGGGTGSTSNTMWPEVYFHTKWHLDPSSRLATIDMGRTLGAVPPFLGRGAGSQSNTMWPTFVPSGMLIHPAVWQQLRWTKNWGLCPLGELGSHLTHLFPSTNPSRRRLHVYHTSTQCGLSANLEWMSGMLHAARWKWTQKLRN